MVLQVSGVGLVCAGNKIGEKSPKYPFIAVSFILSLSFALVTVAKAEEPAIGHSLPEFYIGVDNQITLTRGIYEGLANPNYNRLTLLVAHREGTPHFHGIGTYSYSGPSSNPVVNPTNSNNRIPETSTGLPPLSLIAGKGIFQNSFVSAATGEEYSNLLMQSVATINNSSDLGEQALFNSSGGRWNRSLGNANLSLQLLEISDGLTVANSLGQTILANAGDIYAIGTGDNFSFLPKFLASRPGKYSASFKLVDLSLSWGESGIFNLDFQTVTEPSTLIALILFGSILLTRSSSKN